MNRVLLDSDVILDLILAREPHFQDALDIFREIATERFEPYASAIAVLNVHYFAEKEKDRKFALIEIEKLLSLVRVCTIDEAMLKKALVSPISDYEDAVQCAAAVAAGLDGIVTRNTKDYALSSIPVYSPVEFLQMLNTAVSEENMPE